MVVTARVWVASPLVMATSTWMEGSGAVPRRTGRRSRVALPSTGRVTVTAAPTAATLRGPSMPVHPPRTGVTAYAQVPSGTPRSTHRIVAPGPATLAFAELFNAELFNLVQAAGFWWTCAGERVRTAADAPAEPYDIDIDVFVPVYGEPLEVVEPTIAAATRLRGARVRVALLDDGGNPEMEAMARRLGAKYIRRTVHSGAKAGNLNHALRLTTAPLVAVFDCDHIPDAEFLRATLGYFADPAVAFVQTPQYYANAVRGGVAAAAWAQQALFFGAIARGKDRLDAMFCCGTNVVFRRTALDDVSGFPEDSLTEDFELSIRLHERGWKSAYVPDVLAHGLGPEDMAAYVSQQHRWARGCLSALPAVLRARLPLRLRLQYLLSAMFFLSGWSILAYMLLPVVRILTGAQPLASATADRSCCISRPITPVRCLR